MATVVETVSDGGVDMMRKAQDVWVYRCSLCGNEVEAEIGEMREHLAGHHGHGWTFDAKDIRDFFAEMDPEGPHFIEDDE